MSPATARPAPEPAAEPEAPQPISLPVNCPALPGWVFVPANNDAVCLTAPAKLRVRYEDQGWVVERTFEQGGNLTAHRLCGGLETDHQAIAVLLELCGLRARRA